MNSWRSRAATQVMTDEQAHALQGAFYQILGARIGAVDIEDICDMLRMGYPKMVEAAQDERAINAAIAADMNHAAHMGMGIEAWYEASNTDHIRNLGFPSKNIMRKLGYYRSHKDIFAAPDRSAGHLQREVQRAAWQG